MEKWVEFMWQWTVVLFIKRQMGCIMNMQKEVRLQHLIRIPFGNCYNALKDDGIMVNQQGSPFYAEDAHAMQRSHKRIASTFQISRVYQAHIPTFAAGYWLFGFASKKYHPVDDLDAEAWNALNLRTRYYTTRLHKGAFYLPAFLEDMLKEVEE